MEGGYFIIAAFLLNAYMIFIFSTQTDIKNNLRFREEREKYLDHLMNGFGISEWEAMEQYSKIKDFEDLKEQNKLILESRKKYKI